MTKRIRNYKGITGADSAEFATYLAEDYAVGGQEYKQLADYQAMAGNLQKQYLAFQADYMASNALADLWENDAAAAHLNTIGKALGALEMAINGLQVFINASSGQFQKLKRKSEIEAAQAEQVALDTEVASGVAIYLR